MKKTILITGSSTGIGKATAKLFQEKGYNVVATMRSPEKEGELTKLDNVLVTRLDVQDKQSIVDAVNAGTEKFGQIDILLNNAGYGIVGPVEALSNEKIRNQFDVNFFGVIDVMNEVLPQMRKRKEGLIINVSSIGGRVVYPYVSVYNSTKFALECLTEGMQYELNPLGIKFKLIEPGAIKTHFGSSMDAEGADRIEDYKNGFSRVMKAFESILSEGASDPGMVADIIYQAATDETDRLRYLAGEDAVSGQESRNQMDDVAFKNMMAGQMGLW